MARTRIRKKIERILHRQKKAGWDWLVFDPVLQPKADVVHTFNSVCEIRIPWIVTFESTIPRTNHTIRRDWEKSPNYRGIPDKHTRRSLSLLLDKNCMVILALSQSAYRIQSNMLEHMDMDRAEQKKIKDKIQVLHPPQECLVDDKFLRRKYEALPSLLEFLFVGGDFFRKGGNLLVECLQKFEGRFNFHLTIVSELGYEEFADLDEKNVWEMRLQKIEWITWEKSLPNQKVLELCKKAHIGCLPTLQDTYGYSVLEMQACGCPVITTNVRACPEINNNKCGWVIPLTIDSIGGEAIRYTRADRDERKRELSEGLELYIRDILQHPRCLLEKSANALIRIQKEHNPDDYGKRLSVLYGKSRG